MQDATKAAKNSFQRFLETAAPHTKFETVAFESNADLIQALRTKQVDMVGGSPNQIVEIAREVAIEPAFVAEGVRGFFHDAVLLVPADSPFTSLKDLEGKAVMLLEGAEGGHLRLWLDTWTLREAGRPFESFFGAVLFGRNGSQTTLACFFAKADACLVPRGTFEEAAKANPQVAIRLRELGSSTGLPAAVLAFGPGFDAKLKATVTEIVTHIQNRGMVAPPRATDLIVLQQQHVSPRVVQTMQAPPAPAAVYPVPGPMVVPDPYYVPAPYYWGPPPPYYYRPYGPRVGWGVSIRG